MIIDTQKYIPLGVASKKYNVSREYISRLARQGKVNTINPYEVKIGVFYSVDDLDKLFPKTSS